MQHHPQLPTLSNPPGPQPRKYLMAGGEDGRASGHCDASSSASALMRRFKSISWRHLNPPKDTRGEHGVWQDAGGSSRRHRSRSRTTRSDGDLAYEALLASRAGWHLFAETEVVAGDLSRGGAVRETSGYSIGERPLLDATLSMPVTQARDKGNGKGNETHGIDLSGQLNSSSVSPGASVSPALPSPSQRQCSPEWTDGCMTPPAAFPQTMPEFAA